MKKIQINILAFLLMLFSTSVNAQFAYYNFNGNTLDQTGNGHHAVSSNNSTVVYAADDLGNSNTVLRCAANQNPLLQIPYDPAFDITPNTGIITIVARVRFTGLNTTNCQGNSICMRTTTANSQFVGAGYGMYAGDNWGEFFTLGANANVCNISTPNLCVMNGTAGTMGTTPQGQFYYPTGPALNNDTTFHCYMYSYNDSTNTSRMWIDGVLVNTVTNINTVVGNGTNADFMNIAWSGIQNNFQYFLQGDIDYLGFYNTAFTPLQINNMVCIDSTNFDPICPEICYWRVDANNILNANNIFGTSSNDNIDIRTNYIRRGVIQNGNALTGGNFGWNTTTPSALFHVDCNNHNTTAGTSDVRFENLESNSTGNIMIVENNGYVFNSGIPISSIIPGSSYTADQGITIDNSTNTIQLGDKCHQGGSPFYENREINMRGNNLYFNSLDNGKLYMGDNQFNNPDEDCKVLNTRLEISSLGLPNASNDYVSPDPSTSGLRFTDLTANDAMIPNLSRGVLSLDEDGDVIWVRDEVGGGSIGIQNSCTTTGYLPRVNNTATGNLECSQIFDDGLTSVGINTTSGFGYTAGNGVVISGSPTSQQVRLDVNGLVRSTTAVVTSDKKYKRDIVTIENSLSKIMKLRGTEYFWNKEINKNKEFDNLKHTGFIAQELLEVLPNSVIKDENGDYAVDYNSVIPVLTEAIKEQQTQIEKQSQQNKEFEKQIDVLKSKIDELVNCCSKTEVKLGNNSSDNILYQNVPNPFTKSTKISYFIKSMKDISYINIYDLNGKQLLQNPILKGGNGILEISSNFLTPGIYLYSLIIDGVEIDTKKMVLTSN